MISIQHESVGHFVPSLMCLTLQWSHNGCDGVSNNQPHDCLLNRVFRPRSKEASKLRVIGLCAGNSPVTGEFPAQMASNAENVSIWWRHHVKTDTKWAPRLDQYWTNANGASYIHIRKVKYKWQKVITNKQHSVTMLFVTKETRHLSVSNTDDRQSRGRG